MRRLVLMAMVAAAGASVGARGDTLRTLDASQVATGKLDACLDRNFTPGQDRPDPHRLSARRLLEACSSEWDAAAQACHVNTGNPIGECRTQTGALADDYLNLKSAEIH